MKLLHAIEIFQSILQCKMILALDISTQAKVKNVANPLSISNYLVNLATQAQGQEHAGFEKLIYLILYNERHHIFDLIRQHIII